jgi:hypothetical protein
VKRSGYIIETELIFRSKSGKKRVYDMRRLSKASGRRFQRFLSSDAVEKWVEFTDHWLSVTVYFSYQPK